jgi:RNA polymerase sigma-70 factor, ECF subfamily
MKKKTPTKKSGSGGNLPLDSRSGMSDPSAVLTEQFQANRSRLEGIARIHLNPILLKRMNLEDVLQEAYVECSKRIAYLSEHPEVPLFIKIRAILLQTITDLERKHLACQKRDLYKEVSMEAETDDSLTHPRNSFEQIADTITSPRTKLMKQERNALVRRALETLSETDRTILELRHFEDLTNMECAAALAISPDAASIRYARALQHLQEAATAFSGLRP